MEISSLTPIFTLAVNITKIVFLKEWEESVNKSQTMKRSCDFLVGRRENIVKDK
jgi:predicted metallo-beta-lactamase superfamily hydrolase